MTQMPNLCGEGRERWNNRQQMILLRRLSGGLAKRNLPYPLIYTPLQHACMHAGLLNCHLGAGTKPGSTPACHGPLVRHEAAGTWTEDPLAWSGAVFGPVLATFFWGYPTPHLPTAWPTAWPTAGGCEGGLPRRPGFEEAVCGQRDA